MDWERHPVSKVWINCLKVRRRVLVDGLATGAVELESPRAREFVGAVKLIDEILSHDLIIDETLEED